MRRLATLCFFAGLLCGAPRAKAQSPLAPEPKKEFKARLPVFEQTTLQNGVSVLSYQDEGLPLAAVALAIRTGSTAEPVSKGGLAKLAYALLAHRAEREPGELGMEDLGSGLGLRVFADGARLQLNVMAAQADRAVAALAALVQQPRVDPQILPRVKAQLLAEHQTSLGWSRIFAEEQLRRLIYGPQHPYGHVPSGTPQSIEAITADDIANYYRCSLFPQNVALVVVGRVPGATVREWATRHFGGWQAPKQSCDQPVAVPVATKRTQVVAVARPGLTQSLIMVGRATVPFGHSDEVALRLADSHVSARAYHQLRRKQGITYDVSSTLEQNRYGGHFQLSTPVQTDKTGEALSEIFSQMFAVQRDPVYARFVIYARVGLGWETISQYRTLGQSAQQVARLFLLHQPLAWDQTYLTRLPKIGPNEVDEAGYHYFDRNLMQVVVVGDPEVLRKQLGGSGLGALRWARPDGSLSDLP